METLSDEPQSVLELLASIRRTQNKTLDRLVGEWRNALHFGNQADKLGDRVSRLRSAIPKDLTNANATVLRRDIKEFRADVTGLRDYIDALVAMNDDVKTDMTDIKTKLDLIYTRFEESDV